MINNYDKALGQKGRKERCKMKWLNGCRMRCLLVGFVAVVVLGGGSAKADFTFGEPTNLGPPVNSSGGEFTTCISSDGLSFYFACGASARAGFGRSDIWISTRQTSERNPEGYWGEPINLGPTINSEHREMDPRISADGLELLFSSDRPNGYGAMDIYLATRESIDDDWGSPMNLGGLINTPADECSPCMSANGLELYFSGWRPDFERPGSNWSDIWVSTRSTKDDPWGESVNLGPEVNSSTQDARPSLSPDGLLLCFDSQRHGRLGDGDLYVSRRTTLYEPWGTPMHLGPIVNSLVFDEAPNISFDGSTLFFDSRRAGGFGKFDIWQAQIIPIVDLNGDGIIDAVDMCIMVDYWGTDYSLCDIGPMPWGDGVVDVQDLIVLAEHLFEELPGRPIQP